MREHQELMTCPVANISLAPLDDCLDEWHGNIRGSGDSAWSSVVVHFIVNFPSGYPNFPPRVRLSTFIPHLNVVFRKGSWEICLDMLQTPAIGSLTLPFQYWSSAFSVRAILIQLTSFLLCESQPTSTSNGNMDRAVEEAKSFACLSPLCQHTPQSICPPFATVESITRAPLCFPQVEISGTAAQMLQDRMLKRRQEQQLQLLHSLALEELSVGCDYSMQSASTIHDKESVEVKNHWVAVAKNKSKKNIPPVQQEIIKHDTPTCLKEVNIFATLVAEEAEPAQCSICGKIKPPSAFSASEFSRGVKKCTSCTAHHPVHTSTVVGEWRTGWRAGAGSAATEFNMKVWNMLSRDNALCVMSFCCLNDILSLSAACRGTSVMVDDWVLWKRLLHLNYPRSALRPSDLAWRHAYLLEANGLSGEMRCFHSLATSAEDVLVMPVEYTINPKTQCLDYATSNFDVLGYRVFTEQGLRRDVWGEKFSSVIPYYLDEVHFKKGIRVLETVAKQLIGAVEHKVVEKKVADSSGAAPKKSGPTPHGKKKGYFRPKKAWTPNSPPEMMLSLITKLMNTQVVLLCDKGIAASDSALSGYCQVHRLLLAVVQLYPELKKVIHERLDSFVRNSESRVKAKTPSLGELLTYLSVSDSYSWKQVSMAYIMELFDRSILWSCTKDPSLAKVERGDMTRIDKYLETQRVSLRLTLFHVVFLDLLVRGGGDSTKLEDCKDRYDTFQGRPPLYLRRLFHKTVKDILALDSWPEFFRLSQIPLPSKGFLLTVLENAVQNSIKKGYHSEDTVFKDVMKSGVSKILLKGETYSAAPNLKTIQLLEKWRFDGPIIYLDASCLIYDFHGKQLGLVDYAHREWSCVRHSGDVIRDGGGQHTIEINMTKMFPTVKALFFTVSAWTTSLKEVSQPTCHLHDVESDSEMCRYMLEGSNTGTKTAVIMCKLHRASPAGRWELTTIGHVGYGRAGNYASIEQDIKKFL